MTMDTVDRQFLVLLGSARRNGNTEILVRKAMEHVDEPIEWINLLDVPVQDYLDVRHTPERYAEPTEWERKLLEATLRATDIVIASPLYMYSVSTSAKRYLDHWSGWDYVPGYDFPVERAKKTLWGVSALGEEDHSAADPLVNALRLNAEWLKMHFAGVLLGTGNRPGEVLNDSAALERAKTFFARSTVLV